jgi:transcription elongation factor Elf1
MARPFKCPFCGSSDNVNKGFRKTKSMGLRKIRRCKGCGRKFTPRYQQAATDEDNHADLAPASTGEMPEKLESEPETTDESRSGESAPPAP